MALWGSGVRIPSAPPSGRASIQRRNQPQNSVPFCPPISWSIMSRATGAAAKARGRLAAQFRCFLRLRLKRLDLWPKEFPSEPPPAGGRWWGSSVGLLFCLDCSPSRRRCGPPFTRPSFGSNIWKRSLAVFSCSFLVRFSPPLRGGQASNGFVRAATMSCAAVRTGFACIA